MFNKNLIFSLALTANFGSSFAMLTTLKEKYHNIENQYNDLKKQYPVIAMPLIPLNLIATAGLVVDCALKSNTLMLSSRTTSLLAINYFSNAYLMNEDLPFVGNILTGLSNEIISQSFFANAFYEIPPQAIMPTTFGIVSLSYLACLSGINGVIFFKRALGRNH